MRFAGVGFAVAAFSLWVLADTSIKLAGRYNLPAYEIITFIGLFAAAFVSAHALWRKDVKELWPKQPKKQLVRACLDLGNNFFVVVALHHMPLTLFYVVVFTAPLAIALLAAIFLRERLEWRRIVAILAGFGGVVIAVDPLSSSKPGDATGYAACALCVACFATSMILSRVMAQTERPESMTFFSGLVMAAVGSGFMLRHAAPVSARLIAVLLATGLFCALGNICLFVALRYTTASTVSQYHYTQLVSGAILAYLFFGERPTLALVLGSIVIIGSGLYIAWATRNDRDEGSGVRGRLIT